MFEFDCCKEISNAESKCRGVEYLAWRAHSARVRGRLNIAADYEQWTGEEHLTDSISVNIPKPERMRDLLDIAWAVRQQKCPGQSEHEMRKDWFCNLSQSVHRSPWGAARTLCTSSLPYSFELGRALLGEDLMMLQGFHKAVRGKCATFGHAAFQNLAGESFSLPCSSLVIYAFCLNSRAPWWQSA